MLKKIHNKIINQIKNITILKTTIGKDTYSHTLIATIDNPSQTYLVEPLNKSFNGADVCQMIDSTIKFFEIKQEIFFLFLSDAARYMVSPGKSLKISYPELFNMTCTAHLLHNCCLNILSNYFKR